MAKFPLVWDGQYLAPVEPRVDQLAELIEVVCEYDELPKVLAWALAELPHVRQLRNHLLDLMQATGTWKVEGGALAAALASRELEMLLADRSWSDPAEVLNPETVPAGVAWLPVLRLCEARLSHRWFSDANEEAGLVYVLKHLREKVTPPEAPEEESV